MDRDEVLPAGRFRIVLAQYDAIGSLQVVDGTNVFAVSLPTKNAFVGEGGSWNQFQINHVISRLRQPVPIFAG